MYIHFLDFEDPVTDFFCSFPELFCVNAETLA